MRKKSLSKLAQLIRVQKSPSLFLLTILLVPIQLNKFFFVNNSLVLGIPIDYRAPAIYLIDLFILLLIPTFIIENRKELPKFLKRYKPLILTLLVLNLYLIISSIFSSQDPKTSIIFSARILEASLFGQVALFYLSGTKNLELILKAIKFSLAWESLLVIYQFTFQKSATLFFLGERSFDTTTTSIAHTNIFGAQLLRPYGTFPHPNVLGAFFFIFLFIAQDKEKTEKFKPALLVPYAATILTFSKTTILLFIAFLVAKMSKKFTMLFILVFLFGATLYINFFTQNYFDSTAERIQLINASLEITKSHLIGGVGANNFILALSKFNIISVSQVRLLQPVHNVFLLILAENGLPGLTIFMVLLYQVSIYAKTGAKLYLFFALIVYLSIDHFMWTLEQGRLLFFLALAYIVSSQQKNVPDILKNTR